MQRVAVAVALAVAVAEAVVTDEVVATALRVAVAVALAVAVAVADGQEVWVVCTGTIGRRFVALREGRADLLAVREAVADCVSGVQFRMRLLRRCGKAAGTAVVECTKLKRARAPVNSRRSIICSSYCCFGDSSLNSHTTGAAKIYLGSTAY